MQAAPLIEVAASAEAAPVPSSGDAADDIAFWLHPTQLERSRIVGTHKQHGAKGGLYVYDLTGRTVSEYAIGTRYNQVDVRYGFNLAGKKVNLSTATNSSDLTLQRYVQRRANHG